MTGMIHGFAASDWIAARDIAREILIGRARRRANQTITYGDLVAQLPIAIDPHDARVSYLLDEISRQEHAEGRGFLTVLVVHKHGDTLPGEGFFTMAQECGEEWEDRLEFYVRAMREVLDAWHVRM